MNSCSLFNGFLRRDNRWCHIPTYHDWQQYHHNVYLFSKETCSFNKIFNITFIWCINEFLLLNNFTFSSDFLLMSADSKSETSRFLFLSSFESSVTFHVVSEFQCVLFRMLWMPITVNKVKHKAYYGPHTSRIMSCETLLTECFSI